MASARWPPWSAGSGPDRSYGLSSSSRAHPVPHRGQSGRGWKLEKSATIASVNLRSIPSVHDVFLRLGEDVSGYPRELVMREIRRALERRRKAEAGDDGPVELEILAALEILRQPTLRRVINATGVILHTNLGRAPLGQSRSNPATPTWNTTCHRTPRQTRRPSLGPARAAAGRPAIAVNNGAAAVFLVLNELACGQEAIVSRGELIEIGDGFRIPEIMARSGVVLREVGTTNRTCSMTMRRRSPIDARAVARASQQFPHDRIHRAAVAQGTRSAWARSAACPYMRIWAAAAWSI